MASIGNDRNGRKRILFVAPDGKRKTIGLGKMTKYRAKEYKTHIEFIVSARIIGEPIPEQTARWISARSEAMRERLTKAGLIAVEKPPETHDVIEFVDEYIVRRTDSKPATRTVWKRTRNHLDRFFSGRNLDDVTIGDAKVFRRYLLSMGLAEMTVRRTCGIAKQFFQEAIERGMIDSNPFKHRDIPTTTGGNKQRFVYVSGELSLQVLDILPDDQ